MKFEKILICGLGAIGANTLLNVIRDLPEVGVWGLDMDKVAPRNYVAGTQPYTKNDLNRPKTQAMQMIAHGQSGKRIGVLDKKLETKSDILEIIQLLGSDLLIVDAFDTAPSRNLLHDLRVGNKFINVLHSGFSPAMTSTIIWDEDWTELSPTRPVDADICAQQGARSFIVTTTGITSSIISDFYFNDVKKNVYFDKSLNLKVLK